MEDNKLYPEQNETPVTVQGEDAAPLQEEGQAADPGLGQDSSVQDAGQGVIQDVEFIEQPYAAEEQAAQNDRSWQGGVHQSSGSWQNGNVQNQIPYQDSGYRYGDQKNDQYGQNGEYRQETCYNSYGNAAGQDPYQNGYQNNYQNNWQNGYQNNYQDNWQSSYPNSYQNNWQNGCQNNGQTELEEPVKISEWVLALVLMLIPCVNIIMMFVWAFSSTEKKSKSNFFKAYLIFFGISMGIMLLLWAAIVFVALLAA